MTKAKTAATHLGCRKANDPATGDVTVVIESPRGSPHKYTYDQDIGAFRLAAILPEGITFPFDFGFVPSTRGEDGYPLDVMVLLDYPVPIGCVLTVRLIGVIEAEQREPDGKWVQNDRFLGVATHAHAHSVTTDLDALRPGLLDELEGFFDHYNQMRGKEFRPLAREGPKKAGKAVHRGMNFTRTGKAPDITDWSTRAHATSGRTRAHLEHLEGSSAPLPPRLVVLTMLPSATDANRQLRQNRACVTDRSVSARDAGLVLSEMMLPVSMP